MDPLSVAASVAGLASFTLELSTAITTYVKAVKDAPKSAQEIIQELTLTQAVLEKLDSFLKSQPLKHASFDPSSVLFVAITSCNDTIRDVYDQLQDAKQNGVLRVLEKLKWPFSEKETQKRLDALRRCVSTFQFSLTVEGCDLLSRTSEGVTKTLELQLYSSKKVLELTAKIETMNALTSEALKSSTQVAEILQLINTARGTTDAIKNLSDNVDTLTLRSQETKEQHILDWLSSEDYSQKHGDIRARRLPGTGKWLLGCKKFQAWLDGANTVLWCTGSPGVGKSVLTSLVIDHIYDKRPSYTQGLAYFYFDFADQVSQTPTRLVESLLRQLASQTRAFPQSLLDFYQRFKEARAHCPTSELRLILKEVCEYFTKCFIVIDALDECQQMHRKEVLHTLDYLNMDNVRLFATNRPHSYDVTQHFKHIEHIEVAAHEADIQSYCLRMIDDNDGTRDLMDNKLKVEVADTISKNAQGMFLLPVLQMQSILEAMTRAEIRKSIRNLSTNLGQAFINTMRRIDNEPKTRREVARKALMWIYHSCRPLLIDELRFALAIQVGEKMFDSDNMIQAKLIIDCCLGLVVIDNGSSVVRLVHHTLQDFLRHEQQGMSQNEETEIAKACLTSLCLENVPPQAMDGKEFLEYAAAHWGSHASRAFADQIDSLAMAFLTNNTMLARAEGHRQQVPNQRSELAREAPITPMPIRDGTSGLHVAAAFGLARLCRKLLDTGLDSNSQDIRQNTPLHEAACNGQTEAAIVLLERGSDPNLTNIYGNTALYLAVSFAFKDVILLLLRYGADPNVPCIDEWTAIHKAADKGHFEILKILHNHGGMIHSRSARGLVALHRAAGRGHLEIVEYLLDHGSPIDTTTKDGWTPLHGASSSGQHEAVRLLLEHGASIDHQSQDGRTPLNRASRGGHQLTVALLLSKNANHLIADSGKNLPLHRAAKRGDLQIAKLLLDHDPSARLRQVTAQHSHGRTPRAEASYCGHWKTASMLREVEALHHRVNSDERSALDVAVEEGDLEQVEKLLDSGVDVNKLNPDGVTPLHQAFLMGNEALADLLIQRNADFEMRTSDGWTPLHCAAKLGNESAVWQCLNNGADIQAATSDGQTVLHKACKSGVPSTTKLLVQRGADLEASDQWGWRPLHTASAAGFKDIVEVLIGAGANTEARDKSGRTIQACAAGAGHHTLVEYLRMERHRAEVAMSRNVAILGSRPYMSGHRP